MPYRFGSGWHGTSSARPCSARDPRHRVVARCRALQATRQTRTVDRSVKSQESPPRISSPRTRKDDTATSEIPQFRVLVTTPAAADTVGRAGRGWTPSHAGAAPPNPRSPGSTTPGTPFFGRPVGRPVATRAPGGGPPPVSVSRRCNPAAIARAANSAIRAFRRAPLHRTQEATRLEPMFWPPSETGRR